MREGAALSWPAAPWGSGRWARPGGGLADGQAGPGTQRGHVWAGPGSTPTCLCRSELRGAGRAASGQLGGELPMRLPGLSAGPVVQHQARWTPRGRRWGSPANSANGEQHVEAPWDRSPWACRCCEFYREPSRLLPWGWGARWPVPLTGHSACVLSFLPDPVFCCPLKETSACPVSQ